MRAHRAERCRPPRDRCLRARTGSPGLGAGAKNDRRHRRRVHQRRPGAQPRDAQLHDGRLPLVAAGATRTLDPSSSFEFMNPSELWGHILTPSDRKPERLPDGSFYQVIRNQGKFNTKLPLHRYPFDTQILAVELRRPEPRRERAGLRARRGSDRDEPEHDASRLQARRAEPAGRRLSVRNQLRGRWPGRRVLPGA